MKTYAEWRAEVDKHPDQVPKASSVLRTEGLETPTDVTGQYLPSTMTKAFADAVTAKVEELREPETPVLVTGVPNATVANNLETSLSSSLFTIVAD